MNINQQYISERNSYSGQIPRYIVIHNTDNYSTDADARAHAMAQYHGNVLPKGDNIQITLKDDNRAELAIGRMVLVVPEAFLLEKGLI